MYRALTICLLTATIAIHANGSRDAEKNLSNGRYQLRYSGDLKKATEYFTSALNDTKANDHQKSRARFGLAACASRQGNAKLALEHLTTALKGNPKEVGKFLSLRDLSDEALKKAVTKGKTESPKVTAIRQKLDEIVIDTITFKDAKITEVFAFLRKKSKALDPSKKGVNFSVILRPPGHAKKVVDTEKADDDFPEGLLIEEEKEKEDADDFGIGIVPSGAMDTTEYPEPTITMDFNDIPLGQAIRYICEQANLKYKIEEYCVVILGPNLVTEKLGFEMFAVDPRLMTCFKSAFDNDEARIAALLELLEGLGVGVPKTVTGDQARYSFNPKLNRLAVWNTEHNIRLMRRIIKRLNITDPQVTFSTKLLELDVEERVLARVRGEDLARFIFGLPGNKRTTLGDLNCCGLGKKPSTSQEAGRIVISGKPAYIQHKLMTDFTVSADNLTIKANVDWSFIAWEPKLAPKPGQKAKELPLWSSTVKKQLTLWDGEQILIKLAPARPALKRGPIYLVVQATIADPGGIPIREHPDPKDGWLDVKGNPNDFGGWE